MDLWSAIFTVVRRWYVSLPIVLVAIVAMVAVGGKMKPDYETKASMVFNPPQAKIIDGQQKPFANQWAADPKTLAAAVYRQLNSTDEQKKLNDDGFSPKYTIALDQFTAIMDMVVTGKSEDQAIETANQLIKEAQRTAQAVQRNSPSRPPDDELVAVNPVSLPVDATIVPGSKTRVMATIILLGLVGAASAAFMVESLANRRRQARAGGLAPVDPAFAGAYPPYPAYPSLPPGPYAGPSAPGAYAGYLPAMPGAPGPVRAPGNGVANGAAPEFAGSDSAEPAVDELDSLLDDEITAEQPQSPARSARPQSAKVINRGRRSPRDADADSAAAEPVTGRGRRDRRTDDAAVWTEPATVEPATAEEAGAEPAPAESPTDRAWAEREEQRDAARTEAEGEQAALATDGSVDVPAHDAGSLAAGPDEAADVDDAAVAEAGTEAAAEGWRDADVGDGAGEVADVEADVEARPSAADGTPAEAAGQDDAAASDDRQTATSAQDGRRGRRSGRSSGPASDDPPEAAFFDQDQESADTDAEISAASGAADGDVAGTDTVEPEAMDAEPADGDATRRTADRNGAGRRTRGVNGERTGSERLGGGRAGVERAPVTRNGGNPRPTSRRARRSLFATPSRNVSTGSDSSDEAEAAPVAPEARAPHGD